ncbi:hypothetical protein COCHEDRAFT_72728, partial [Bipolaris maydis C5]
MDIEKSSKSPSTLRRKGSALQTSVEVLRCRFGKSAEAPEKLGDFRPSKEWTPIFYSVYHQREAALSHFLRAGASPDDVTDIGQPPLCIAVANGYVEIAKILLGAGADINATTREGGETALHIAVKNGRVDLMDLLLSYGPNLELKTHTTGETPLHYAAAKSGSLATVRLLLRARADPTAVDNNKNTPLLLAVKNHQWSIAPIFVTTPSVNAWDKNGFSALHHECPGIDIEVVRLLLARDAKPGLSSGFYKGRFPLHCAVKARRADVVEELLLEQGNVECVDDTGRTPMFFAAEAGDLEIVTTLLTRGAKLDVVDLEKNTLLHAAAVGGSDKVIASLLRAGAKLGKNAKGLTPM